jgi:hypothetical protein
MEAGSIGWVEAMKIILKNVEEVTIETECEKKKED